MRNGGGVLYDNKVTLVLLFSISFFWMTSLYDVIFVKNTTKLKIELLIIRKWSTPRWKGIIRPHLKNEDGLTHCADLLMTPAVLEQKLQK